MSKSILNVDYNGTIGELSSKSSCLLWTSNENYQVKWELNDLTLLHLAKTLGFVQGREECFVQLTLNTLENGPSTLYFHPNTTITTVARFLDFLLSHIQRQLIRNEQDYVYDVNASSAVEYTHFESRWPEVSHFESRWPSNLPLPNQNSTIYKLGSIGMNLLSSVIGKPITNKIEDVGWNVLESFSQVTAYAKDKTASALEHPLAKPFLPLIPDSVKHYFHSKEAERLYSEYETVGTFVQLHSDQFQSRPPLLQNTPITREIPIYLKDIELQVVGFYLLQECILIL